MGKPCFPKTFAANYQTERNRKMPDEMNGNVLFLPTRSSLVHNQVENLIHEHKCNYESIGRKIKGLLDDVQDALRSLPPRAPCPVSEFEGWLRQTSSAVSLPHLPPPTSTQLRFGFAPPTDIAIIGSFALRNGIRDSQASLVDLAVTMPGQLLDSKDFLDYRYSRKRACYLACLAQGLEVSLGDSIELAYAHQDDDDLRPCVLVARPITEAQVNKHRNWLRIIVVIEHNTFNLQRLQPWRTCIRMRHNKDEVAPHQMQDATPFYNSTILAECLAAYYDRVLKIAIKEAPGFRGACILARIWLHRQGFASGLESGGFGGFESACCLALLLQHGFRNPVFAVSQQSDAFLLFVSLLQLLAYCDAVQTPIIFGKNFEGIRESNLHIPIIYDAKTYHNLFFKMSLSSYYSLKSAAKISIDNLSQHNELRLEAVFTSTTRDFWLRYDHVLKGGFSSSSLVLLERLNKLHSLLTTALSDRVHLIDIRFQPSAIKHRWSSSTTIPAHRGIRSILVGLKVNPVALVRRVDMGPPIEEKDRAEDFRRFWGDTAELRRFTNGEIRETVTWPEALDEIDIVNYIISHIVKSHLQFDGLFLSSCCEKSFSKLLSPQGLAVQALNSFETVDYAFKRIQECLWSISGNPLKIRKVSASGPGLRYACLRAARPTPLLQRCQPLDLIVQFEGSVRWPENMSAIQYTKTALLTRLGDLLIENQDITSAQIGLENEGLALLNLSYLDIVLQGLTFRIRIYHNHESTLLERRIKDVSVSLKDRELTVRALVAHNQSFVHAVQHTESVRELCISWPLLSPTIRIIKLWTSTHLLRPHFSEEVLELITIFVFTSSHPKDRPGSLQCAFLRVLSLVANWDWQNEPLIVTLSATIMPQSDLDNIVQKFHQWRKNDPAMHRVSLFVASTLDHGGTAWTSPRPSIVAINRFVSLCRAACTAVANTDPRISPQPLFERCLTEYDFIIRLRTSHSDKTYQTLSEEESSPADDPDTCAFITELERVFSGYICFFHDYGIQAIIGGLWMPRNNGQNWTVASSWATEPASSENGGIGVTLDKTGILRQIAALGRDLISHFTLSTSE